MNWLLEHASDLIAAFGTVVMLARIVVKLTPTPDDDTFLDKLLTLLKHIGLHV